MTETQYHVGHLAEAREADKKLDALATELWNRAKAGQIVLCQRRVGEGVCAYYWKPVKGAL